MRDSTWHNVGRVFDARVWPVIGQNGRLTNPLKPKVGTMREAATYLAIRMPTAIKRPDEGWTRSEVAWVVDRQIRDGLGIREYGLDDDFVRDLGVD
jgi:hypothetical protein